MCHGSAKIQTAELSGYDVATECTNEFDCLQLDGSGFYIVPDRGHAFFHQLGSTFNPTFLEDSTVWGLTQSLDWLASTANTAK